MKENLHEVCVITRCPFCGRGHEVEVNESDYWDWDDGVHVQDAFPYLSAGEREMLVSGICPNCWDKTFGQAEDEEEEEEEGIEEDWGYNEDMGFDPYLGCYTDDC